MDRAAAEFGSRWSRVPALGVRIGLALALAIFAPGSVAGAETGGSGAATGLVHHPDYLAHDTGAGHPERPARLRAILEHLERGGLLDRLVAIAPAPAETRWLTEIHTPAYLEALEQTAARAPARLDADTAISTRSYEIARLAAGGVLAAVDAVMAGRVRNAFVASRPPGHHALPDRAMGFCLLNHVAIAARYLQRAHGVRRVLIVDWDVHHGNGTQDTFYSDPTVLYFSTHQMPWYPGTGAAAEKGEGAGLGFTVNAPLPAGAGDAEIVAAFESRLVPAADAFRPEFVLVSAGFDAHRDDPLAQLDVTEEGFAELTRIVAAIAKRHAGGRLVSVLEGGYDLDALGRSVEAHIGALLSP